MVKAENIYTVEHFKAAQTTLPRGKTPYIAITALILFAVLFGSFAIVRTLKAFRDDRAALTEPEGLSAARIVRRGHGLHEDYRTVRQFRQGAVLLAAP